MITRLNSRKNIREKASRQSNRPKMAKLRNFSRTMILLPKVERLFFPRAHFRPVTHQLLSLPVKLIKRRLFIKYLLRKVFARKIFPFLRNVLLKLQSFEMSLKFRPRFSNRKKLTLFALITVNTTEWRSQNHRYSFDSIEILMILRIITGQTVASGEELIT